MTNQDQSWPVDLPDCVRVERKGAIAILSINRPEKRNALSDELVLALQAFFSNVPDDVLAIVLQGAGDHFCAGLDLNEVQEAPPGVSFDTSMMGQGLNNTIQYCKVPVISVLHGAVVGGGLEIAAASHIRVAERTAFYALPEGTRGIFLGSGGSVRLPRLIGVASVMDMMLSGRVYNAEDGHNHLRFSQYLVDAGEGLGRALEIAESAAKNSRLSNYAIIQALPRIAENDPNTGLPATSRTIPTATTPTTRPTRGRPPSSVTAATTTATP
ncbi:MAG: crotonase/enoyl-CoA hydratase family protein [Pseudomonadota bacterium]